MRHPLISKIKLHYYEPANEGQAPDEQKTGQQIIRLSRLSGIMVYEKQTGGLGKHTTLTPGPSPVNGRGEMRKPGV